MVGDSLGTCCCCSVEESKKAEEDGHHQQSGVLGQECEVDPNL